MFLVDVVIECVKNNDKALPLWIAMELHPWIAMDILWIAMIILWIAMDILWIAMELPLWIAMDILWIASEIRFTRYIVSFWSFVAAFVRLLISSMDSTACISHEPAVSMEIG